jgi:CRP-like cAMP-binding protein
MSYIESIHSLATTVEAGTVIFEEGTAGGGIIVLLAGRLLVKKSGHEVGIISEPGSYVGESTFVTGKLRSATVIAENSATIIRLSAQQSAEFLQTKEAEAKILKSVTERLTSANEYIKEHGERNRSLEVALVEILKTLKEVHDELALAEDDASRMEVGRRLRVLINKFGRAELVGEAIVI